MINFNTNILETNLINLSFVIGVLIYFGGDVLNSLLDDRLKIIQKSLDEVKVLKENLQEMTTSSDSQSAADSLAESLAKSEEDLKAAVERMRTEIKDRYTKEISDLEIGKKTKIAFEEDKATSQLAEQIKKLTVQQSLRQVENRIVKARADIDLGLVSDVENTTKFNHGKKFGFFFKDSLRKLSQVT